MSETLEERVSWDDLIKDLAGERRKRRCQQQEEGRSRRATAPIQLIHTPITHQYFLPPSQPNWIFFFSPSWSMTGILAAEEGGGASKDCKQEVSHGAAFEYKVRQASG